MNALDPSAASALPDEGQRRASLVLRTLAVLLIPILTFVVTLIGLRLVLGEPQPPPPPPGFGALPLPPPGPGLWPLPPHLLLQLGVPVVCAVALLILVRAGRAT